MRSLCDFGVSRVVVKHLGCCGDSHHPPVAKPHHSVAHRIDLIEAVAHEDDGPTLAVQASYLLKQRS